MSLNNFIVNCIASGTSGIIVSRPGTGKTTTIRGLCEAAGLDLWALTLGGATDPARVAGTVRMTADGQIVPDYTGTPREAVDRGIRVFFFDELNRAPTATVEAVLDWYDNHAAPAGAVVIVALNWADARGTQGGRLQAVYDRFGAIMYHEDHIPNRDVIRGQIEAARSGTWRHAVNAPAGFTAGRVDRSRQNAAAVSADTAAEIEAVISLLIEAVTDTDEGRAFVPQLVNRRIAQWVGAISRLSAYVADAPEWGVAGEARQWLANLWPAADQDTARAWAALVQAVLEPDAVAIILPHVEALNSAWDALAEGSGTLPLGEIVAALTQTAASLRAEEAAGLIPDGAAAALTAAFESAATAALTANERPRISGDLVREILGG